MLQGEFQDKGLKLKKRNYAFICLSTSTAKVNIKQIATIVYSKSIDSIRISIKKSHKSSEKLKLT